MKTLAIAILLFASCFALNLEKHSIKRDVAKRDVTVNCYASGCSDIGGPCSTTCDDCYSTFTTCQSSAFGNNTALCDCYSTYVDCTAAKKSAYYNCDSVSVYEECTTVFSFYGNCSCGTPYTGSITDYECSSGYCSNTSVCTAYKTEGQSCSSDDECGENTASIFQTAYVCTNSQCQKVSEYYPGDPCTSNNDCAFYFLYNLGCSAGVCASQAVGKECPILGLCGGGLYCADDQTCQKMSTVGGQCNSTAISSSCPDPSTCDNNVCVAAQSKKLSDSCVADVECTSPLYCSITSGKCANPLPTPSCISDSNCTNINKDYYGCVCTGTTATCQTSANSASDEYANCLSSYNSLQTCLNSNGCSFLAVAGSCADVHCASEFNCYYACAIQHSSTPVCTNYKPTCDSGVEKNVAAWALIAIALFSAFMF